MPSVCRRFVALGVVVPAGGPRGPGPARRERSGKARRVPEPHERPRSGRLERVSKVLTQWIMRHGSCALVILGIDSERRAGGSVPQRFRTAFKAALSGPLTLPPGR